MKRVVCLLLASGTRLFAQNSSPTPLARAAAFVKEYMRGATENRFDITTTLTTFSATGKLTKTRKATYRLEFVKGRFKGAGMDESQEGDWESTIRVSHSSRQMVTFEVVNDVEVLMAPAFVFGPKAKSKWSFDVSAADSGPLEVKYHSIEPCSTFEVIGERFRPKLGFCGAGRIYIDEHSDMPMRVEIEAVGLPVKAGKTALTMYRGESEFQYVSVAGSRQRLVFPKNATGTFVFDDHKMVIRSSYTFHPGKW